LKSQDFNIGLSITATNGYGPIELNTSNGEFAGGDGHPITLNGQVYPTGLGVHANSEIHIHATNLQTPACTRFQAAVGVDDEVGSPNGSVVFQVFADGVKLFDSGVMTGASATQYINVGIGNKSDLRFVVTDAGDNSFYDHADWAGAALSCAPASDEDKVPTVTALFGNHELTDPNPPYPDSRVLPTTVTITGTNLQNATVTFGTEGPGTNLVVNDNGTQLTVIAPSNRVSQHPIIVSTPYGKVNAGIFYFHQGEFRPFIRLLSITPITGPLAGGTAVKLNYTGDYNYTPASQPYFSVPNVYFGEVKSTNVYLDSSGSLIAVSPPGAGFVDVTMRCPLASCYSIGISDAVPFRYQ